jgi:hypothetical protein
MARGISHRDVTKEQYWREQLAGQPNSGLSVRAYCRRHRLRESAFYFWRKELARRGVSVASGPTFVPVHLSEDSGGRDTGAAEHADEAVRSAGRGVGGCIEIVLSGGRQVRLLGPVDRQSLADVLAVLEGRPC